jgi:L-ascorbate metabolism protein UlaG (beta-lactamase superfamily)
MLMHVVDRVVTMIENIQWLGHGSFLIEGSSIVYINPWKVSQRTFHADVILISHHHYDSFSPADIEKLSGTETIVISNERVQSEYPAARVLRPWNTLTIDRMAIKAVPAYSPDSLAHPLDEGGLGFVISWNYYDIYYAGDTGHTPEMEMLSPDIVMLPIDGAGTLTVEQAVSVVEQMQPKWVYPMNWGRESIGATHLDALRFRDLVGTTATVVLPETMA